MTDLYKLLFVLVILVILLARRANLGAAMVGVSILSGLLFQLDINAFWQVTVATVTNQSNVELIVALGLIMIMEEILRQEGMMQRMLTALRGLVGDARLAMAALPALVGLIPSMGGAIFSAPMVEEMAKGSLASAERRSFINYWYRHIWEFVLPLYPALLLAAQVFNVPVGSMVLVMLPVPVLAVLLGWPIAFRGLNIASQESKAAIEHGSPVPANPGRRSRSAYWWDLTVGLGPVAMVLLLVLILGMSVALAVGLVVAILMVACRFSPGRFWSLTKEAVSLNVLFAVAGVLFFKEMLIASKAVGVLTPSLSAIGYPVTVLFFLLPFLVGILTGAPQAAVGTTAPILIGLAGAGPVSPALAAMVIVSTYCGVMLSPAHLCLVLTVSYFQADFGKVYRMVMVPEALLTGVSLAYLALLQ